MYNIVTTQDLWDGKIATGKYHIRNYHQSKIKRKKHTYLLIRTRMLFELSTPGAAARKKHCEGNSLAFHAKRQEVGHPSRYEFIFGFLTFKLVSYLCVPFLFFFLLYPYRFLCLLSLTRLITIDTRENRESQKYIMCIYSCMLRSFLFFFFYNITLSPSKAHDHHKGSFCIHFQIAQTWLTCKWNLL